MAISRHPCSYVHSSQSSRKTHYLGKWSNLCRLPLGARRIANEWSAARHALRTYALTHVRTYIHRLARARARKKRNTLKKKGMTSHARWWHTARAASFVDGVRIIVALTAEGRGEKDRDDRELYHRGRGARESRKGGAGRGQAPRGVR